MNYIKLPHMDAPVSVHDICQAHAQLEDDYNVNGMLWERPSNRRRLQSTGVQLRRMKFSNPYGFFEICSDADDAECDAVRDVYLINVLKWHLPMDGEMRAFVEARYTPKFLKEMDYEKVQRVDAC